MRICVAVPSISDFYFSIDRMSALGARTVCRIVSAAGHQPAFLDFPNMGKRARSIPCPPGLAYLEPYILDETGPVAFFTGYKRLGPGPEECARMIAEVKPDLLLISCFAYAYAEDTVALARAVRSVTPDLTIAVGGAGATALPDKFLFSGAVSFVISGEAETNLETFLSEFSKKEPDYTGVPGLWYIEGSRVRTGSPRRLTQSSELEWIHAITGGHHRRLRSRLRPPLHTRLSTSLSRGCPKSCAFCSNHLCHGRRYRETAIDKVFTGLDSALAGGHVTHVNFEDDNLFANKKYALEVIRYLRGRENPPAVIAENGIDSGFLDSNLLEELIDLGLSRVNFSLGSVDPAALAMASRNPTADQIAALTARAAERGVESVTYFICGLPGDTRQSVTENLLFLSSLQTRIGISLFYAVPGMPGFEEKSPFIDSPAFLCCGSSAFPWTKTLPTKTMVTAFRLARFINLLKEGGSGGAHHDLISRTLREQRLYTWRKTGSGHEMVAVPHLSETLAREVISNLSGTCAPG